MSGAPVDPTTTGAWAELTRLADGYHLDLREAVTSSRVEQQTSIAADLLVDLSKNLWDDEVEAALLRLADEVGVLRRRDARCSIALPSPASRWWRSPARPPAARHKKVIRSARCDGLHSRLCLPDGLGRPACAAWSTTPR